MISDLTNPSIFCGVVPDANRMRESPESERSNCKETHMSLKRRDFLKTSFAAGAAGGAGGVAPAGGLQKGRGVVPVYRRLSQAERERLERVRQGR